MTASQTRPSDVACLRIGPEGAELVARLQQATLPEIGAQAWSADSVHDMLSVPGTVACVATCGDEPSGVAVGRHAVDEFELFYLGVLPAARRSGLGGRLLARQLAFAREAEAAHCYLEVARGNRPARAIYSRTGFLRVGIRLGYYLDAAGRRHDALLLRKALCYT